MYKITHFPRRSTENYYWVISGFISRDQNGIFRFGIENLTHLNQQEIQDKVSEGQLIELAEPIDFNPQEDKALWLEGPDHDAKLWFANRKSPTTDTEKRLVWSGPIFNTPV